MISGSGGSYGLQKAVRIRYRPDYGTDEEPVHINSPAEATAFFRLAVRMKKKIIQ